MSKQKVPTWISAPLILGTFGLLVWLERRRPLRRAVEPKLARETRNLTVAALSAAALQVTEKPLANALTSLVERRGWGLLKLIKLPAWLEVPLALVLLDYTLYMWHVLAHRVRFLWRFHLVHHVDLDLDTSTALRFHFAEMLLSIPWRATQIVLIGVTPPAFSVWQLFLFLSILFHHSNVELPEELERRLNRLLVTPRMHGIHHSMIEDETNSNWSSGLTVWDTLHGTLKLNVPQDQIRIGVPAYSEADDVRLAQILALPFVEEREAWQLPDETTPTRRSRV